MGFLDAIRDKLEDSKEKREEAAYRAQQESEMKAQERADEANANRVKRNKEIQDALAQGKIDKEIADQRAIRAQQRQVKEGMSTGQQLAKSKPVQVIGKTSDKIVAGVKETIRKTVAPTAAEREAHSKAKDAAMERKIHEAEQQQRLRKAMPHRPNPPGRPKSYKESRGSFKAPSYNKGKAYMPSPRSFGGVPGGMDNFMGGISPRRGAHPDPLAGLGRAGAFGDPFAGLGGINPNPKPAPKKPTTPAKKGKGKRGDVHITISRNPMIKGLGKIVGVPRGYKPRGKNPFDF